MATKRGGSAALRVTWRTPAGVYELRWYGSPEYVVPMWWLGLIDPRTGRLDRTEVFHAVGDPGPDALFHWLVSVVGVEVAWQLVSAATEATSNLSARAS
jgi:hypothetical protein